MNDEEKEKARIEFITSFQKMTKEEQEKVIKMLEDAGLIDKRKDGA